MSSREPMHLRLAQDMAAASSGGVRGSAYSALASQAMDELQFVFLLAHSFSSTGSRNTC
jgi:hypothetical protein